MAGNNGSNGIDWANEISNRLTSYFDERQAEFKSDLEDDHEQFKSDLVKVQAEQLKQWRNELVKELARLQAEQLKAWQKDFVATIAEQLKAIIKDKIAEAFRQRAPDVQVAEPKVVIVPPLPADPQKEIDITFQRGDNGKISGAKATVSVSKGESPP